VLMADVVCDHSEIVFSLFVGNITVKYRIYVLQKVKTVLVIVRLLIIFAQHFLIGLEMQFWIVKKVCPVGWQFSLLC
jgi:hypothetical protein